MQNKNLMLLIILAFAIINLKFQCGKNIDVTIPEIKFDFKEPVTITPYTLNKNVGDTIWLRVNVPDKSLFDTKTNTRIVFDSANFNTIAQVDLLYNNPFIGNKPYATFVYPQGVSAYSINSVNQTISFINYGCAPSASYNLNLGIVLIEKGVFGISLSNTSIVACFTGFSKSANLRYEFDVNDTHKQFYEQLPFATIGKRPDDLVRERLDKKGMVVMNVQ